MKPFGACHMWVGSLWHSGPAARSCGIEVSAEKHWIDKVLSTRDAGGIPGGSMDKQLVRVHVTCCPDGSLLQRLKAMDVSDGWRFVFCQERALRERKKQSSVGPRASDMYDFSSGTPS